MYQLIESILQHQFTYDQTLQVQQTIATWAIFGGLLLTVVVLDNLFYMLTSVFGKGVKK